MCHRARVVSVLLLVLLVMPSVATSAPDEYRVGARDLLKITVWGHDDLSKEYPVDPDGFLQFPLIGRVKAAGLTTQALATSLTTLLEKDYLVNPQVIVAVKEYLSQKVHVVGEAERPGLFYLTGPTSILEILSKAGGVSKTAGKQLVLVRNPAPGAGGPARGSTILRLNLDKIQAGDPTANIAVQDEDMILIQKGHAFFVLGEVKKTGTFPLDRPTSVLEAITMAEGFNENAAPSGVKVIRRGATGQEETVAVDLSGPVPKDRDFKIQDGDSILVPRGNTFFVFGEVKRPGSYQLNKETNILEGITIAGGFTDKAAPARTRVIRSTPTGQQVFTVDLNDILKRGQRDKAIVLQENDVVVVPESFF